jgi:hypothetical protein
MITTVRPCFQRALKRDMMSPLELVSRFPVGS